MLTENMLWAWNVDIFVRLDLRGWAPPLLHITTLTTDMMFTQRSEKSAAAETMHAYLSWSYLADNPILRLPSQAH